jgi:hypothetical protein
MRPGLLLTAAALLVGGCGLDLSGKSNSDGSGGGAHVGGVTSQSIDDLAAPVSAPQATAPQQGPTATPPVATPPAAAPTQVVAEGGVGKQGQGYGGGIITEPIKQRFVIEQRLIFDQITHAINLYKATNGNAPKSHEEFMEQIIQANGIALPELPAGQTYIYDPETEQLMVERPQ